MTLKKWGWDDAWAQQAAQVGVDPAGMARVVGQDRGTWSLQTPSGPQLSRLPSISSVSTSPVVGDWVHAGPGPMPTDLWSILAVLPRRSTISRGAAGTGKTEQVLAANVDKVWVVHGLDIPLNLRSIERYLTVVRESGAIPEIILTKSDLVPAVDKAVGQVQAVVMGATIRTVSSTDPASVQDLQSSLAPGCTVSLFGPSGVGKSTLVNLLARSTVAQTGEVRESDGKGRHTTTRRELFLIPCGALLLDTPGIRELRRWVEKEGLSETFPDIEELAQGCRFRDCRHAKDLGCAVQEAINRDALEPGRLESFQKLQSESVHESRKSGPRGKDPAVTDHKTILKTLKNNPKYKNRSR
jgi:ribosome biogenesis GTPase